MNTQMKFVYTILKIDIDSTPYFFKKYAFKCFLTYLHILMDSSNMSNVRLIKFPTCVILANTKLVCAIFIDHYRTYVKHIESHTHT